MKLIFKVPLITLIFAPITLTQADPVVRAKPIVKSPITVNQQDITQPLKVVTPQRQVESTEDKLTRIGSYLRAYGNTRLSQTQKALGLHRAYAETTKIQQQLNSPRGKITLSEDVWNSQDFRTAIHELSNILGDLVRSLDNGDSKLQFKIQEAMTRLTHAEKAVSDTQKQLEKNKDGIVGKFKG